MVKLVISGGGDYTDSKKVDEIYKGLLGGGNVLYIPRAFYPEKYPSCEEWIKNTFLVSEGYNVHMLSEEEYMKSDKDYLSEYDGIYIGGGNTFRLLKVIRETGFSDVLQQFLKNNKPIYGGSAGAVIMGKEIHTSPDMNAVKLGGEETMGFNMCDDYAIYCHYDESKDNEIKEYVVNYQIPVICLPEGTGCVFDKNICTVQGEKSAYKFDMAGDKHELPIGSEI